MTNRVLTVVFEDSQYADFMRVLDVLRRQLKGTSVQGAIDSFEYHQPSRQLQVSFSASEYDYWQIVKELRQLMYVELVVLDEETDKVISLQCVARRASEQAASAAG